MGRETEPAESREKLAKVMACMSAKREAGMVCCMCAMNEAMERWESEEGC